MCGAIANPYRLRNQRRSTPRTPARASAVKMYRSESTTNPALSAGIISFSNRSAKSVAYSRTKVSLLSVLLDLAISIVGCISGERVQPVSTTP